MNLTLNHHKLTKGKIFKDCCIGFTTTKGVCLDLDNISEFKARKIAQHTYEKYKLEGYLIMKSSNNHYHIIFNKYITWRKVGQIIFGLYIVTAWGIWQMRKGEITLRISKKNMKNKPKEIMRKGKTDKLIKDYLYIYNMFKEY